MRTCTVCGGNSDQPFCDECRHDFGEATLIAFDALVTNGVRPSEAAAQVGARWSTGRGVVRTTIPNDVAKTLLRHGRFPDDAYMRDASVSKKWCHERRRLVHWSGVAGEARSSRGDFVSILCDRDDGEPARAFAPDARTLGRHVSEFNEDMVIE